MSLRLGDWLTTSVIGQRVGAGSRQDPKVLQKMLSGVQGGWQSPAGGLRQPEDFSQLLAQKTAAALHQHQSGLRRTSLLRLAIRGRQGAVDMNSSSASQCRRSGCQQPLLSLIAGCCLDGDLRGSSTTGQQQWTLWGKKPALGDAGCGVGVQGGHDASCQGLEEHAGKKVV